MLVEAWLARAARTQPHRVAIQAPDGQLTYGELAAAVAEADDALRERGVAPGDRVAIALPNGVDFAIALHACARAKAVAVPVDLRLGEAEQDAVVAGAVAVVAEGLASRGVSGGIDDAALDRWPQLDLDAPAAVIHTSGTSGTPKAVTLSHGNWLWSALGSATALGVDPDDRWLGVLPPAHVGGLSIFVRSAIYATTAIVHERFETDAVLEALMMRPVAATLVSLVPTTLGRLLDAGLEKPPSLRCALIGGAPASPQLLERARAAGVVVSQTYGLTEACSQVTTEPVAEIVGRAEAASDAGPPLFCTRVAIAADGEIIVRGPTVAAASIGDDGWLHTGDEGELVEGRLRVTGRKADTIVSGGENVSPDEVEAVLASYAGVAEAAVIGRSHPEWGEAVCAVVVARPGADVDPAALRSYCATRLAPFKVPKTIELRDDPLPRTRSGKLIRRGLK